MKICYKCEICNQVYNDLCDCESCEAQVTEEPILCIGQEIRYAEPATGYETLYNQRDFKVIEIDTQNHIVVYHFEEYNSEWGEWESSGFFICGNKQLLNPHIEILNITAETEGDQLNG